MTYPPECAIIGAAADTSVLYFTFVLWRRKTSLLYLSLSYFGAGARYKKHSGRGDPSKKIDEKKGEVWERV